MNLEELIRHVGSDNCHVQNLDANMAAAEIKGGNGHFTFLTDPKRVRERMFGDGPPEYTGVVVWMPTKLLPNLNGEE